VLFAAFAAFLLWRLDLFAQLLAFGQLAALGEQLPTSICQHFMDLFIGRSTRNAENSTQTFKCSIILCQQQSKSLH